MFWSFFERRSWLLESKFGRYRRKSINVCVFCNMQTLVNFWSLQQKYLEPHVADTFIEATTFKRYQDHCQQINYQPDNWQQNNCQWNNCQHGQLHIGQQRL